MAILVSVVIPVYNAIPYLEACLESVAMQTYRNLEVVAINDGSTDASEEMLQRYARTDQRFKVYSQENHGLGHTRNRGISLSQGSYVFFLDSDDILPPKAISSLVEAAEKSDADYVVGKVIRFDKERQYAPPRHVEFGLYKEKAVTTLRESPELMQDSIACNKLWKKELFTEHQLAFTEGKYYEDLSLTLKSAVLAKKIQVLDEVVYQWRVREEEFMPSITQQQMKLENTAHRLEALEENRKWLIQTNRPQQIIDEHDLKSLLDVIRLHVLKYALISEEEKVRWKELVYSYLKGIPAGISYKLPDKEKLLYQLMMAEKEEDLMGLSQLLTDTEKSPVVRQEHSRFVFEGAEEEYEVTKFNKPKVIVEHVEMRNGDWQLSGKVWIPKASRPLTGSLYARDRKGDSDLTVAKFKLDQPNESSMYPFEEQAFTVDLDASPLIEAGKDTTYDFYFKLDDFPRSPKTRVRLYSAADPGEARKAGRQRIFLYRTNYGNLSSTISKPQRLKSLVKKILPLGKG
ncbi:glycosyltransferase family 2 protein [Microbacterium sp. APC 3898]|uniref:Glycosyltransferase family 2 protein n=1 Tax=Planococcus notacanthi TaxID=3035188 RepID=A0ABT7ZFD8_9BACL|nr:MULTISPECIES: glycosyltransferase family 2 protein [Terrabacteria group]MDN3425801.1 glycosyltransferase family 2 protein [Planococcus sp. APC 4016]MDN3500567.1 glycosyltransferase family 2 protein [Microbacterium sp. APC 3898]